ncbi:transglutaminase domain-containing protein [Chitinophaga tropicalis]|uniref:Transglutaminase-like domain-containing protein n=1 Tax=Chitinophaga tropicalis TaxID=2683588 RepID=A0A7K1U8H9_9BACT|nr:transglutaminase domain-containing protein [Chitinophaga tropicalis]MVT10598.1 hypothetical protein [Chitinophaga tropicalis]
MGKFISYFILLFILGSCSSGNRADFILNRAGANRQEIETALHYFQKLPEDSLQFDALLFLLENSAGKFTEIPVIKSRKSSQVSIVNWAHLPPTDIFESYLRKTKQYITVQETPDIHILKADYLIKNVLQSFEDWHKYPWNQHTSYHDFLHYLLPFNIYRNAPDNWREFIINHSRHIIDSLANKQVRLSRNVYNTLISSYPFNQVKYTQDFLHFSNYPSLSEIMYTQKGECFNIACMYVYLLRAAGIPSTIDIVPYWGTQNAGHSEAVFLNETGKLKPYDTTRFNRAAKVYRFTTTPNDLLINHINIPETVHRLFPDHLLNNYLQDVTDNYVPTTNLTIDIEDIDNAGVAFLCVQNHMKWQPLQAGIIKEDLVVTFEKMNSNVVYQMMVPSPEGKPQYIGSPFILTPSGEQKYFTADTLLKEIQLSQINPYEYGYVKKSNYYTLFYLDGVNWVEVQQKECSTDSSISFENINSHGLFELKENNTKRSGSCRCFTYENGKQIWW